MWDPSVLSFQHHVMKKLNTNAKLSCILPLSHYFVLLTLWLKGTHIYLYPPTFAKLTDSQFRWSLSCPTAIDSIQSINQNTVSKVVWMLHDSCRREGGIHTITGWAFNAGSIVPVPWVKRAASGAWIVSLPPTQLLFIFNATSDTSATLLCLALEIASRPLMSFLQTHFSHCFPFEIFTFLETRKFIWHYFSGPLIPIQEILPGLFKDEKLYADIQEYCLVITNLLHPYSGHSHYNNYMHRSDLLNHVKWSICVCLCLCI